MQRRHRPVPIEVPPETSTKDFKLTDSGVFETGGLVVSKTGCIITRGGDTSSGTQLAVDSHSVETNAAGGSLHVPSTQVPATSRSSAVPDTSAQLRSKSGSTPAKAAHESSSDTSNKQVDIVLDDLEELSVIGSGSSGVVKKVKHKTSGAVYVLKVINFDMGSEQVRRQVTTEVKALDGARHPHIVSYHQSYFANGALTILMEFMDGGSLWDVLQKIKVVPQCYLPELARQVLSGLSYLHETARICHRDIKPGNLLLSSNGQLKISDFGVSSQLSNSMSRCLSWVGTVTYMSPERIRGDSYSFNTDVWSVGLLLMECATGKYPYPPENAAGGAANLPRLGFWELLEYIVVEPAPKLPAGQFSVEFADFLGYCLQKDPAKRPSAGLLLQHPFITGGPRSNLSDLLQLPQTKNSRSRTAVATPAVIDPTLANSAVEAPAAPPAASTSGTVTDAGPTPVVTNHGSSSSVSPKTEEGGCAGIARNRSACSSSSSGNSSRASSAATSARAKSKPSSFALAGKLAPYTNTYQLRPTSVGSATVVKVCASPAQQQHATKQSSMPSCAENMLRQRCTVQQQADGLVGQQQQQQPHTPHRAVPQQHAHPGSQRLPQQQVKPGQTVGQQAQSQPQSPLRPLMQPLSSAEGSTPGSAGPLTTLKPKSTPRKHHSLPLG